MMIEQTSDACPKNEKVVVVKPFVFDMYQCT